MRRSRPKVAFLGGGFTQGVVPPLDPDAEQWGVNRVMLFRFPEGWDAWDRWFDYHPKAHIIEHRPDAYAWYRQQDGRRPIYLLEPDAEVAGYDAYPREAIQAHFGQDGEPERDFWGSLAWMFALAIFERKEAIDLFWCPMRNETFARHEQIASTRYWIGRARQAGVRVTIHGDSDLKPVPSLYGVEACRP